MRLLNSILTLHVYLQEVNLEISLDLHVPQYLLPVIIIHGPGHEPHEYAIGIPYIPRTLSPAFLTNADEKKEPMGIC